MQVPPGVQRRPTGSAPNNPEPAVNGPKTAPVGLQNRTSTGTVLTSRLTGYFAQQKLRAWQPVLTPKWIIWVFLVSATAFLVIGIVLLITVLRVTECTVFYPDPSQACSNIMECTDRISVTIRAKDCIGPASGTLAPPLFLYYRITNFFQNHRHYVRSRNDRQLRGEQLVSDADLASCYPIIRQDERILSPCGLVAWSVFNDSFTLASSEGEVIEMDERPETIAWSLDVKHRFRNPPEPSPPVIYQWLNEEIFENRVENGHFIVWMRNAALSTFRKLYGRIDQEIKLPVTVLIANRYPVTSFGGTKAVLLTTVSWIGGRNLFLGIAYIGIGCWCAFFGLFFASRNYKNPRILGDVRYLKWVSNKKRQSKLTVGSV